MKKYYLQIAVIVIAILVIGAYFYPSINLGARTSNVINSSSNSDMLIDDMGLYNPTAEGMNFPNEIVITNFSTASSSGGNWTKGGSGIQIGDDTDYIKSDRSLKLTTDGDGVRVQSRYSPFADSATIDISGKHLKAWIKIDKPEALESNSEMRVWLTSNDFSGYAHYKMAFTTQGERYVRPNVWTQITWYQEAMAITGVVDFSAINGMQMTLEDDATDTVIGWFGGVSAFDESNEGIVTFTFDDGAVSQYTEGRKKLNEYGYPATAYVIRGRENESYAMSIDQMTELQDFNGWDIAGHGGTNLTTFSESEVETELLATKNWLLKNNFSKGADHYALPYGAFDEHTVLPLVKKYFTSNKTIFIGLDEETLPPNNQNKLRPVYITNETATSSIYTQIDNCKKNNLWCILTFHKIVPIEDVDTSTEYSISDFAYIVDYINTSGIKVKTVSDVINTNNFNNLEMVDGKIGIGTTTPATLLDIYTIATTTATIDSGSATQGACTKYKDVDGGGYTYCIYLNGTQTCSVTSCE